MNVLSIYVAALYSFAIKSRCPGLMEESSAYEDVHNAIDNSGILLLAAMRTTVLTL